MIDAAQPHSLSPHWGRAFFIGLILTLMPTTLACTGLVSPIWSVSEQSASVLRLPTFTRTPLPTFTPTFEATLLTIAKREESASPRESIPTAAQPLTNNGPDSALEVDPTLASPLPEKTVTISKEGSMPPETLTIENSVSASQEAASPSPPTPTSPITTVSVQDDTDLATFTALSPAAAPSPTVLSPATVTATRLPIGPPTATPTATPTPTDMPPPSPTVTPLPEGWVFTNVRNFPDPNGDNLLVYGDVINNTGTSQDLRFITGTFYNEQGQVATDGNTLDYWPVETIPAGSKVPFELTVFELQSATDVDLRVEAVPSNEAPSQDFEFSDVNQTSEDGENCVSGKVRNPGEELRFYLSIVAILYDGQDKVINFRDHYHHSPENLIGDQTLDFKICIDPLGQEVARFDVRAWGL